MEAIVGDTMDLEPYGIGQAVGARLVGGMELAARWRQGFRGGGNTKIRSESGMNLFQMVFQRQGKRATEGELIALILGGTWPDPEKARLLFDVYGNVHGLFSSFVFDISQGVRRGNQQYYIPLRGTEVELTFTTYCRLFAGIEIARRYRSQAGAGSTGFEPGALGLDSDDLVKLLDPTNPLDQDLRTSLIAVLRSHPQLADDFAKLDRLAEDARTRDYQQAIELHQMFERLRKQQNWTDPAKVLGDRIPYHHLLAIAEARITRASTQPTRMLKVKELLERAEEEATKAPVDAFVNEMLRSGISPSGADRALEEAGRRYRARLGKERRIIQDPSPAVGSDRGRSRTSG